MPPEPVRVLFVDDEPAVRATLRAAVAGDTRITVVGEAGDGLAAIDAIEQLRPDLVFLDVQMPGCDGFDVLHHFAADTRPTVVFVTAYEEYAVRAFDAHAIDYVLKPFDDARVATALARALRWVGNADHAAAATTASLLSDVTGARHRTRFVVRHAGRLRIVHAGEIEWIEARGNYAYLHTPEGEFLLRETMHGLADGLDPASFQRVHRSAIVALPAVTAVERLPAGDASLVLRSGARVRLGRTFRTEFDQRWRGASWRT